MDRSLVREYEGIIKTMKEQIAVLKAQVARKAPNSKILHEKEHLLRESHMELSKLREKANNLTEHNRQLSEELTSFQLGVSQVLERSQIQDKLL